MPHDDRYDSAAGWTPKRPNYDAIRRRIERERIKNDPGLSPFETSSGQAAVARRPNAKPPAKLFGGLWHEGEVALLAGPAASGKSILAVQIADQIARPSAKRRRNSEPWDGRSARFYGDDPFKTAVPHQKVLYVDFAQTAAQFAERYTAPNPVAGKLPLRHRFPNNFIRAGLGALEEIPQRFRNDPHRYFHYWLMELIEETRARVLILDNLSYLARPLTGHQSAAATAKNLKWWAQRYQISILATVNTRPASYSPPGLRKGADAASAGWSSSSAPRKPAALADIAAAPPLTDLADTVFTISPSTLGPDLRYIKHLKSRRETDAYDASTVFVCQLGREAAPSPVSLSPASPSPFLGLTYLGLSPESIHLTDPFAPQPEPRTEKRVSTIPRLALRSQHSKDTTDEMLLSRE